MKFPYSEKVLEHFKNPKNVGRIENPDGQATEGSSACGDMVSLTMRVDESSHVIEDIKFESYGCASNIATASVITELAKGKTIDEAKKLTWRDAENALGGLPNVKVHCSVLAIEALHSAITNYEERHGLITEREPTTMSTVETRLKKVMNPERGLDIVKTGLVTGIVVSEGTVTINLSIPASHQFASSIREDITEKVETLWDIESVQVVFSKE